MTVVVSDIRLSIFQGHMECSVTGVLIAEAVGVLSGIGRAREATVSLGARFSSGLGDGDALASGQEIARVNGNPLQIAQVEEQIIGTVSKSSGIATAARRARQAAESRLEVVSGGWKKMPPEIKEIVRQGVWDGGIRARMVDDPFIYLDKNYVRILGGPRQAVLGTVPLKRAVVVQLRGETASVDEEAVSAAEAGAAVVMIDTGRVEHLTAATRALRDRGLRSRIRVAFGGNVRIEDLEELASQDLDLVDIGAAVLDAPCLPMRFDVVSSETRK